MLIILNLKDSSQRCRFKNEILKIHKYLKISLEEVYSYYTMIIDSHLTMQKIFEFLMYNIII
jgi:hypothetical protein